MKVNAEEDLLRRSYHRHIRGLDVRRRRRRHVRWDAGQFPYTATSVEVQDYYSYTYLVVHRLLILLTWTTGQFRACTVVRNVDITTTFCLIVIWCRSINRHDVPLPFVVYRNAVIHLFRGGLAV